MSSHKKKSPSKFERIMLCPGSCREEEKYPEPPSGKSAIEGTHDHTLLEICVNDGLRDPEFYLGNTIEDHEGKFVVDSDRVQRVRVAVDYIIKRKVELGFSPVHSELYLSSIAAFGRDDMGGTCDVHICANGILEVIDYKGGRGEITLPSVQLDLYTLMILSMYDLSKYHTVRQTIIQPKLPTRGENGVVWIERPVDELLSLISLYRKAAEDSDKPDAPLVPGEKQCRFCKHAGACVALNSQTMASLGIASPNLDAAKQVADKDPLTMSGDQLRELIEAAPLIRQVLEAAEKEALRRLEGGERIAGLKLVRSRGSRQWAYSEDEMVEKLKKFGIPKDELWKTTLISPAQAEKVVWKKKDGTVKQLTERQLKTLHEEYVKKTEGKLTVAPESDERPAVSRDVSSMFGTVGEEVPAFLAVPDFLK